MNSLRRTRPIHDHAVGNCVCATQNISSPPPTRVALRFSHSAVPRDDGLGLPESEDVGVFVNDIMESSQVLR